MWKHPDSHILHGDHVRAGGRGSRGRGITREDSDEPCVVVRDDDSTGQRASDEEDSETEVDGLECSLEVLAWVLYLSGNHP